MRPPARHPPGSLLALLSANTRNVRDGKDREQAITLACQTRSSSPVFNEKRVFTSRRSTLMKLRDLFQGSGMTAAENERDELARIRR